MCEQKPKPQAKDPACEAHSFLFLSSRTLGTGGGTTCIFARLLFVSLMMMDGEGLRLLLGSFSGGEENKREEGVAMVCAKKEKGGGVCVCVW